MKSFFAYFLIFCLGGCAPRLVENPAGDAPTYHFREQEDDYSRLFKGEEAAKVGLIIRSRINLETGHRRFRVVFPEGFSPSSLPIEAIEKMRTAIQKELGSIEEFRVKYAGKYRMRYPDGDLKILSLTKMDQEMLDYLVLAWQQTLRDLEGTPSALE